MSSARMFNALASRWLRNRQLWWSGYGVAGVVAVFVVLWISISAFSLSGEQEVDRLLGGYDNRLMDTAPFGDEVTDSHIEALVQAATSSGARQVGLMLTSTTVFLDQLPAQFTSGPYDMVLYFEDVVAAPGTALPGANPLASGRMPTGPGEVALSVPLARELGNPAEVSVFGGALRLSVTGTVAPTYGENSRRIVAAPGTWRLLPAQRIRVGYRSAQGSYNLFWNGSADIDALVDAVVKANPRSTGKDSVDTGLVSRDVARLASAPPTERWPSLFLVPGLVIVGAASLLAVNASRRRLLLARQRFSAIGLDDRLVLASMLSTLSVVIVVATAVGAGVGIGAGWGLRHTLLPWLVDQPLSPMPALGVPLSLMLVTGLAVAVVGGWLRLRRPRVSRARSQISTKTRFAWTLARRCGAVVALAWAFGLLALAPGMEAVFAASSLLVAGIVLLVPDIMAGAVRLLSRASAVQLAARRMIESDRARYSSAVIALVFVIAVPTVFATVSATLQRSEQEQNLASVSPGHLLVRGGELGGVAGVAAATRALEAVPGLDAPVLIGAAKCSDETVVFDSASKSGSSALWVMASSADLKKVVGDVLTDATSATLDAGGLVTWHDAAPRLIVGSKVVGLPSAALEMSLSGTMSDGAGAVLASTIERLGCTVETPIAAVYTGVSEATRKEAVEAVIRAGITPKAVAYYTEPLPITMPAQWHVTLIGLVVVAFLMLWALMHWQAKHLRGYAARLLAVGLDQRWSARVFFVQAACVAAIGVGTGLLTGLGAIAAYAQYATHHGSLTIPWGYIGIVLAAAVGTAVTSTGLAVRQIRPESGRDV